MKIALWIAVAIVAMTVSPGAGAQASAPLTREQVKAETRAAAKAGTLTPAGQGAPTARQPSTKSTKTRAQRKAETVEARKKGELRAAGDRQDYPQKATSSVNRAQRKAETREAVMSGQTVPAGQGPDAPTK